MKIGRVRVLPDYKCPNCKKYFRPKAAKTKFCSYKCSSELRPKKGLFKNCRFCGSEFYVSQIRKGQQCCCQEHTILLSKKNAFRFSCKICGKEVLTQPAQMSYRHRQTCSMKCRSINQRLVAEERRKRLGYTKHQLDRLARYSHEAATWRKSVFERDNWTCQVCKVRGNRLEADHIKPWAYFPDLRFELSNGRTLCRPCHDKTKMSAKRMKEIYGKIL